jgi:hypothetical protein
MSSQTISSSITMVYPRKTKNTRLELANRLFFRLYQCANMLHKTGTRAVEKEGLTTQQWAVLGALSRSDAEGGMSVGDLARYLKVSRQNLSGQIGRMARDGQSNSVRIFCEVSGLPLTLRSEGGLCSKMRHSSTRPRLRSMLSTSTYCVTPVLVDCVMMTQLSAWASVVSNSKAIVTLIFFTAFPLFL